MITAKGRTLSTLDSLTRQMGFRHGASWVSQGKPWVNAKGGLNSQDLKQTFFLRPQTKH